MTVTPMQAGALKPIVDRTGRESSRYQYVRELLKNAIEAGATQICFRPEWSGVETSNVYRFLVADDGIGMDEDKLPQFLNTFGGGGKPIGDVHENFGMGAKTSMLPWNHHGILIASRQDGHTNAVRLECDASAGEHGEYGLFRWVSEDDEGGRFYEEVLDLDRQEDEFPVGPGVTAKAVMDSFLDDDHGTVIIAFGMTGEENTYLATGEGGVIDSSGDIKGLSKYLNERFWEIPLEVSVHELRSTKPADWPRSAGDAYGVQSYPDRRINNRAIQGARHWLCDGDYRGQDEGTIDLADDTKIHWFLWHGDRERKAIHSYARKNGYIAVLYDGELYHYTDHAFSYRRFGIVRQEVRRRLTLIVEPPAQGRNDATEGVYPHAARSSLYWTGARDLPMDRWGEEFIEELPAAIRKAIMSEGDTREQEPENGDWLEQIATKFKSRFKRLRLVPKPSGKYRAKPLSNADKPAGPVARAKSGGSGGSSTSGSSSSGQPTAARKRDDSGIPAEEKTIREGLPPFRWVSEQDIGEAGRAAVWVKKSAETGRPELLINREFPVFQEIFNYWWSEYPPHYEEDVRKVVETVYGTELSSKVAHAHELKGQKDWDSDQFESLLSSQSLTLASMGLYSCHQVISTMLGGRLGRGSTRRRSA